MATALHPQTLPTLTYDGQTLPTKLGYKNPKLVTAMFMTNEYPGGYWEDQGYDWFGGI